MAELSNIKKSDEELQVAWGVVYAPDIPDSHGDFMNAEEIRKMAYKWAERSDNHAVDVMHDNRKYSCFIVESFIVREGDPDFPIPGSWVAAVHVPDPDLWAKIKDGTLNGFSMEALAYKKESEVDITIPALATGVTDEVLGHTHTFEVWFDNEGNLIGGRTSQDADENGVSHLHVIKKSVVTEDADGHNHRFAYIDQLVAGD